MNMKQKWLLSSGKRNAIISEVLNINCKGFSASYYMTTLFSLVCECCDITFSTYSRITARESKLSSKKPESFELKHLLIQYRGHD